MASHPPPGVTLPHDRLAAGSDINMLHGDLLLTLAAMPGEGVEQLRERSRELIGLS